MMTNEDPGYIMGGPQMTDPYNFEYMRRQKEKRESEGIRLKKGGPVKKYEGGGMVQIEIKVGGGGKRKGMHKMPDGSMMEDSEHEAEEYRKGGPVKKAAGGKVAAKPMSRPVAKAKPMARPMPAMKRGGKVMMKGKYK